MMSVSKSFVAYCEAEKRKYHHTPDSYVWSNRSFLCCTSVLESVCDTMMNFTKEFNPWHT